MFKIGEFSKIARISVKTIRYCDRMSIIKPVYVDKYTHYRYYSSEQLQSLQFALSLRQIGFSIQEIKNCIQLNNIKTYLNEKKQMLLEEKERILDKLSRIEYLLKKGDFSMKYEIAIKQLPEHIVYYKQGFIKDFSQILTFILQSADECLSLNPALKCIQPDYCYVSYLDKEFKKENIRLEYAQAVEKMGKENENIKFKKINSTNAISIYVKGDYSHLPEAYVFVFDWIEKNNYLITECARERYIDGMWNKQTQEEWLTEIQIPVSKK